MSKPSFLAVLVAAFLFSSSSAEAQAIVTTGSAAPAACVTPTSRPRTPGYRQHDGFYLRTLAGAGVGGSRYREGLNLNSQQTRSIGSAGTLEVAVGWALFENFIVHATLNGGHIQDERKEVGKRHYDDADQSTIVGLAGGGLTYYLMPANVYVTGSVGVAALGHVTGSDDEHHETKAGVGTSFAIGKEWWLGGQWGLGVALTGAYYQGPLDIDGVKSTYRGFTSGAALSATFN